MRLTKLLIPIFVLVTVLAAGPQVHSQKVVSKCGFISEASGKSVLRRGTKYYLVSGMEGLYYGESIRVPAGSKVIIAQCATNLRSEIIGPAEFTVTAKNLVFKSGSAKAAGSLNPDLCPFFMEETFKDLNRPEVMANGEFKDGIGEMTGVAYGMGPGSQFDGYLTDVQGDVFLTDHPITRVTGEVAPGEDRLLVTSGAQVSIHSCSEDKIYRVQGPALVWLRDEDETKKVVTFLRGKPAAVEKIEDANRCWRTKESIRHSDQENQSEVGLDGKELKPAPSAPAPQSGER